MTENTDRNDDDVGRRANDDLLDHQLSGVVQRSLLFIRVIVVVLAVLVIGLVGTVVWLVVVTDGDTARNAQQIEVNQAAADKRWCATMDLLTAKAVTPPPDAAANPSREATYELYADFVKLKNSFHC